MTRSNSTSRHPESIEKAIEQLVYEKCAAPLSGCALQAISGDGSSRRFWRVDNDQGIGCIAVAPPEGGGEKDRAEAIASWKIGNHLRSAKVGVPRIYGFDDRHHVLVYEDLGDTHLQAALLELDLQSEKGKMAASEYYRKAIDQLITMQCEGVRDFDTGWCWDTKRYDLQLMLERESGYFLRAFWRDLLKQPVPSGLLKEFQQLADRSSTICSDYFLHRDFQSRNLMLKDGDIRVIDYQGGRLGPLGYDLASLLIDPYVVLPLWFQTELRDYYYEQLSCRVHISRDEFREQYLLLAMQRNLQIIGAFAFLSNVRGKSFFAAYLKPAVESLQRLIAEQQDVSGRAKFNILERVVKDAALLMIKEDL